MTSSNIQLSEAWKSALLPQFEAPYMQKLKAFLQSEKQKRKVIYPKGAEIFNALNLTPLDEVKVVILGQDPYHGPNQAHGLCFSVNKGVTPPPSLINIYKELQRDLGIPPAKHGFLQSWAQQGVLLLNSVLTVENGNAGSHQGKGWETFTDEIIRILSEQDNPIVFMLWGSYAQKKGNFINHKKHLVLTAPHPSPLSAHRGFIGCGHFSKANDFLKKHRETSINWHLPD